MFFSVKEKIKAFKVRKNTIIEKSKTSYEIKQLLEDRQKHLVFLAADDMIRNGLNSKDKSILSSDYNMEQAKKMFGDTYNKINLPTRYVSDKHETSTPKFGFGKAAAPAVNSELAQMYKHLGIEEMLCKSEWLWNQYKFKNREKQSEEEATYSVACLVRC